MTARAFILPALVCMIVGCKKPDQNRDPALPENVLEDRPIILKEGQAVILVPEHNRALMIGAAVTDGKLTVSEIDPHGRDFSVTWTNQESWQTTTSIATDDQTTTLIDKDGDGVPDLRAEMTKGSLKRFTLDSPRWTELELKN